MGKKIRIDLNKYEAAILDMDGVITRSARVHFASWKQMFDEYLKEQAGREGKEFKPFAEEDYYLYVDGKPRYEGARSFLESRGKFLPYGNPDDSPEKETICGLGNRKNRNFLDNLKKHGVESFQSSQDFVLDLKARRKGVAVISSSRNAREVLEAAGVINLFAVVVDGVESARLNLKGKPAADIFLEAAKRLKVSPDRTIAIEDAISGVEAAKAGGFALVIGIDRTGQNPELANHGADIVVRDLSEVIRSENNGDKTSN